MRRLLALFLFCSIVAIGCSASEATDPVAESASTSQETEETETEETETVDVSPSTTVEWEATVAEYLLLPLLDDHEWDEVIGSAAFIMTDEDGTPVFSGEERNPQFLVNITAWVGVDAPIVSTINIGNVRIGNRSTPSRGLCSERETLWRQLDENRFRRIPNAFPDVQGIDADDWAYVDECAGNGVPGDFVSLFRNVMILDVDAEGFSILPVTQAGDPDGDQVRFTKIDPPS